MKILLVGVVNNNTALFYTHFKYALQKLATVTSTSFNTETLFS